MDRLRNALQRLGVRHCVAFVIGAAVADDGALERWLEAGFELGNHTHTHVAASEVGAQDFLASVQECDEVLRRVGAWRNGQPRWFRFPYLDYGADDPARARIRDGLRGFGYRVAHATVDLHDDRFEEALGRALTERASVRAEIIGARYRRTADRALRRARTHLGASVPQVPYFHFGGVSDRFVSQVIEEWAHSGGHFCSLDEALEHPALHREQGTGLILGSEHASFISRVFRRVRGLSNRLDPTAGRLLGPPWPRIR